MKKVGILCSVLFCALWSNLVFSQSLNSKFSGRIIDQQTLFPVAEANIYVSNWNGQIVRSDNRGDFELFISDTLINFIIAAKGYDTLYYFINHAATKDQLIYLKPNDFVPPQKPQQQISFQVIDGKTKQPIPYVNVATLSNEVIDLSDALGNIAISIDADIDTIMISDPSYKELKLAVANLLVDQKVMMEELQNELQTIWVKASKTKYSNKNNPAVELIRRVVAAKETNYLLDTLNTLIYDKYEKVQMGNYDFPKFLTHNFITRKQAFVFDNVDTLKFSPHAITPLYLQEKLLKVYMKDNVTNKREQAFAIKKVLFNDNFIGNKSIDNYLNHIYINFELTDENVMVMTNQFMSPMAKLAPTFYKYFLGDTIKTEDGKELIELYFGPRNKNDFLFLGRLYINKQNYAVEYAKMSLSKDINLNFIKDIKFDIHYTPLANGKYLMTSNNLFAIFNVANESRFGLYGEKLTTKTAIALDTPIAPEIWENPKFGFVDEDSLIQASKDKWLDLRPVPLTATEDKAYQNMDSLYRQKGFNEKLKWMRFLFMGYVKTGIFEIGPTNTFYAFNPVEGLRLRFGGRTMINETKNYHLEAYAAYGLRDKNWKWYGSASFGLFSNKSSRLLSEYPMNYIKITHQNDLLLPGQSPGYVQESSLFFSFKRGVNDKFLSNKYFKIEYFREVGNNIRITPFVQWVQQMPTGSWYYVKGDATRNDTIASTINTEVGLRLRWAPNERIIQGRTSRTEINTKYPIFNFNARWGLKDILGGEYKYQNYNAQVFKRVLIPQVGFINVRLGGNYIVGNNIPFTLLNVASGNQTYWLNTQQYMLMNYMEFISDRNVYLNLEHHLYGFIFNKIPLVKRLKFREVIGVKMLYGDIRPQNMPIVNPNLIKFPRNEDGLFTTTALGKQPYTEVFVGIENIFGFFRIDAIWRTTYLDMPNVSKFGVRAGVFFDF